MRNRNTASFLRDATHIILALLAVMALYGIGFASVAASASYAMYAVEMASIGRRVTSDSFFYHFILYTGMAGAACGLATTLVDFKGFQRAMLGK